MNLQGLRDWYQDLELRDKIEENQSLVIVGLVALIVFCLALSMCQVMGGGGSAARIDVQLAYVDLDSQSIRVVDHTYPEIPASPLEGTDNVFLATVFSCEECPSGAMKDGMSLQDLSNSGLFIGWLIKRDPSASRDDVARGEGDLYRSVAEDRWYTAGDQGFTALTEAVYRRCSTARECLP